jgi:predicted DCC family thiol-disulfide oxidoreductase YuxK
MKTLENKVIIYDDVCPLCKAYTNGFVQLGWLMPQNRLGFSQAPPELLARIDLDRARHEIPLHDRLTAETLYGKDALFFILGEALPLLKPLFRWRLFRAIVFGFYQLITYNRRIIAGSPKPQVGFDCAPDFNLFYRCLYIMIAVAAGTWLFMTTKVDATNQHLYAFGILLALGIVRMFWFTSRERIVGYIGHLVTVLLVAAIAVSIFGLNATTVVLVPAVAVWLMAKRIALV